MIPSISEIRRSHFPSEGHPYQIFQRLIETHINPDSTVLDIGCGRTAPTLAKFKGKAKNLIGLDLGEFSLSDPDLTLITGDVAGMDSIGTSSIDLCYSRSVMEHVKDADAAYREINRVLKPNGRYIFLTPNLWDYASLISQLVPNFLHPAIVYLTEGRERDDTFPAYYKCNTRSSIYKYAGKNNFTVESFEYCGQYPNYFNFNRGLFYFGSKYELFLKRHPRLHPLRGWILCVLIKDPI